MPSAAPLAALERRLAEGGGVARLWGLGGSGWASLSDSEAERLTVTTDDDEMEALRDEGRRGAGAGGSAGGGDAAGGRWMFIVESTLWLRVSQAKPAVNALRLQAWLAVEDRAQRAAAVRRCEAGGQAVVQCCCVSRCLSYSGP